MSSTMTMTLPAKTTMPSKIPTTSRLSATMTSRSKPGAADHKQGDPCCPSCGFHFPSDTVSDPHKALLDAQKQIEDLQAQVRLLNQKAAAAVDRWADYEDELSRLRAASMSSNNTNTNTNTTVSAAATAATNNQRPHTPAPSVPETSPRSSFLGAGASRISALLSPRKSVANLTASPQSSPLAGRASKSSSHLPQDGALDEKDSVEKENLLAALTREKELRRAAEGKLNDTSREIEDLSATLFEQANEMVAEERRARARLEERVEVLERRDVEKRERIGRLEGAMDRLERVRALLDDSPATTT